MRAPFNICLAFWKDERGSMVSGIAKSAIAIGFLSVIAANMISTRIDERDRDIMASLAGNAASGRPVDMGATGSLARQVDQTRFDPCALPAKR